MSLHQASSCGDVHAVERLLKTMHPDVRLSSGSTPLLFAVLDNQEQIVKILLEAGANPCIQGLNKMTPLHLAADRGYTRMVQMLVETNKIPTSRDIGGRTPEECAAQNGNFREMNIIVSAKTKSSVYKFKE